MSAEIYSQGKYILTLAASIPQSEHASALQSVKTFSENILHHNRYFSFNKPGYETLSLRRKQKRILGRLLKKAEDKLSDIGLENPYSFLPFTDQIEFRRRQRFSQETWGVSDGNRQFIALEIPIGLGTDLNSVSIQTTLFHEIGEFVPRIILNKHQHSDETLYLRKVHGFTRDRKFNFHKGVYAEPLATLFSLFCIDRDVNITTPYTKQIPFMIALLKEYAKCTGIKPLDAFKKFFKANAERDFSLQKEFVDIFGTEMVRALNNIDSILFWFGDNFTQELKQVAKMGNFINDYTSLQRAVNQGESIALPGMKGGIKKIPDIEYQ